MTARGPVSLIVLDGWGLAPAGPGNAVSLAHTPTFDRIWSNGPHTSLEASGEAVGLPQGQMGNSEVGHANLGAGRVVDQPVTLIDQAIRDGRFFDNAVLADAFGRARTSRLQLMGLVSDGGVHSELAHLLALLEFARRVGVPEVYVHAFLDGRDSAPTSGARYLGTLSEAFAEHRFPRGGIATLVGRYWAMDRDRRWARTQLAYDALCGRGGQPADGSASDVARAAYAAGETDEFVKPRVLLPAGALADDDVLVFFNFRPDRARQLTHALCDESFEGFDRKVRPRLYVVTMTRYEHDLQAPVAFPPSERLPQILGETVSAHGLAQMRCAETEKYAHVTYFFNNGRERPFDGEVQHLVPSPKVATYDLQPEMSAGEVARVTVEAIGSGRFGFVLVNFANPDMVGHTGVLAAAVQAVEAADAALERVLAALAEADGQALVVADHGNAECMRHADGSPHTAHTTNPVPCIYVGPQSFELAAGGALCDVAPSLVRLLELEQPAAMSGRSLIRT